MTKKQWQCCLSEEDGGTNTTLLLPSVPETLPATCLHRPLIYAAHNDATSRHCVSNLNTTLQTSRLRAMYGPSVYPASITLTGHRRLRGFTVSARVEPGLRTETDGGRLRSKSRLTMDSRTGLNGGSSTQLYLQYQSVNGVYT